MANKLQNGVNSLKNLLEVDAILKDEQTCSIEALEQIKHERKNNFMRR